MLKRRKKRSAICIKSLSSKIWKSSTLSRPLSNKKWQKYKIMILLTRDSMVDKCSLSSSRDTNLEVKLSLNSKIPTLPRCLIVWSARAFPAATTHLLQIVRSSMVAQLILLSLLNLIKQLSEITQWQSTRQIMRLDPGSVKMRSWQILFN